jgi:metal-sulfur cluster biosynthetic enzyme
MTHIKPKISDIKKLLSQVKDPELGIDIVSLGFIKKIDILKTKIKISMVLTFFGCPFLSIMVSQIEKILEKEYEGYIIEVKILKQKWIPPKGR